MATSKSKDQQIAELQQTVHDQNSLILILFTIIESNTQTINALTAQVNELKAEVKELKSRLNQNPSNSSKPPSSQGYNKPNPKSEKKKTGKKSGGQPGHKGANLQAAVRNMKPTEPPVRLMPSRCKGCAHYDECLHNARVRETRRVIDGKFVTTVQDYEALQVTCMEDQICYCGEFPEDVKAACQYGENLQGVIVALNTRASVPLHTLTEVISDLFGIPISQGTVYAMVQRFAKTISSTIDAIKEALVECAVCHFDGTGVYLNGKLRWVQVACTELFTWIGLGDGKSAEAMKKLGILDKFQGIAVHDCLPAYWLLDQIDSHAVCCAHLLRELRGIAEKYEDQPLWPWAIFMRGFLNRAYNMVADAKAKGLDCLPDDAIAALDAEYTRLIRQGYSNAPPLVDAEKKKGREKHSDMWNLVNRMERYQEAVCRFYHDFRVPFTNNQAERDLRMTKTKRKVAGTFRAEDGLTAYLDIISFIATGIKHGLSVMDSIMAAIHGNPEEVLVQQGC